LLRRSVYYLESKRFDFVEASGCGFLRDAGQAGAEDKSDADEPTHNY
jgi:hypothetical protein